MRVLVVHPGADCSVSDVHDGLVHGLRANGVDARSINTNDRLYFYVHAHVPDNQGNLRQAFNELEVGGVIINDIPTYRIDHMPYGGVKDSGLGREGLRWSIEDMTEIRLMVIAEPS